MTGSPSISGAEGELRVVLAAAETYLDERPDDLWRAIARACIEADGRFINRGDGVGPEPLAELLAHWIAERAKQPTPPLSIRRALRATEETPRQMTSQRIFAASSRTTSTAR